MHSHGQQDLQQQRNNLQAALQQLHGQIAAAQQPGQPHPVQRSPLEPQSAAHDAAAASTAAAQTHGTTTHGPPQQQSAAGHGSFGRLQVQLPLASEAPHIQQPGSLLSPSSHGIMSPSPTGDLIAMLASPRHGLLSAAASEALLSHSSETLEAVAAAAAAELQQRRTRRSMSADPAGTGALHAHAAQDTDMPMQDYPAEQHGRGSAQLLQPQQEQQHGRSPTAGAAPGQSTGAGPLGAFIRQLEQQQPQQQQQQGTWPETQQAQHTSLPGPAQQLQLQDEEQPEAPSWLDEGTIAAVQAEAGRAMQRVASGGPVHGHMQWPHHGQQWRQPGVASPHALQQYHSDPLWSSAAAGGAPGPTIGTQGYHTHAHAHARPHGHALAPYAPGAPSAARLVTGSLPLGPASNPSSFSSGAGDPAETFPPHPQDPQAMWRQRQDQQLQQGVPPVLRQQQYSSVTGPLGPQRSMGAPDRASEQAAAAVAAAFESAQLHGSTSGDSPGLGSTAPAVAAAGSGSLGAGSGAGGSGGCSVVGQQQQATQQQQPQQLFTHTRQVTCKTYLKRLNVTQFMSDHMLPCMEGSLRNSSHRPAAARQPGAAAAADSAAQGSDTEADQRPPGRSGSGSKGRGRQAGQQKSYEMLFKCQIKLVDPTGQAWPVIYEGVLCAGQRHLRLTCGWSEFIKARKIAIGDSVSFERRGNNRAALAVYVTRAGQQPEVPFQGELPPESGLRVLIGSVRASSDAPPTSTAAAAAVADAAQVMVGGVVCEAGGSGAASRGPAAGRAVTHRRRGGGRQQQQGQRRRGKRGREYDSASEEDTEEEELEGWEDEEDEGSRGKSRRGKVSQGRRSAAPAAAAAPPPAAAAADAEAMERSGSHTLVTPSGGNSPNQQQLYMPADAAQQQVMAQGGAAATLAAAGAAPARRPNLGPGAVTVSGRSITSHEGPLWPAQQQQQQQQQQLQSSMLSQTPAGTLQSWPTDPTAAAAGRGGSGGGGGGSGSGSGGGTGPNRQRRWQQQGAGVSAFAPAAAVGVGGAAGASGRPHRLGELAAYNRLAAALGTSPYQQQQQQQQQQPQGMEILAGRSSSAPAGGGLPQGWQVSTGFLGSSPSAQFGSPSLSTLSPQHQQQQQQQQWSGSSGHQSDAAAIAAAVAASNSWNEPRGAALVALRNMGRTSSTENNAAAAAAAAAGRHSSGGYGAPYRGLSSSGGGSGFTSPDAVAAAAAVALEGVGADLTPMGSGPGPFGTASALGQQYSGQQYSQLSQQYSGQQYSQVGQQYSQGRRDLSTLQQQWSDQQQQQQQQQRLATHSSQVLPGDRSAVAAEILRRPRLSGEALQQLEALLDPGEPWDPALLSEVTGVGPQGQAVGAAQGAAGAAQGQVAGGGLTGTAGGPASAGDHQQGVGGDSRLTSVLLSVDSDQMPPEYQQHQPQYPSSHYQQQHQQRPQEQYQGQHQHQHEHQHYQQQPQQQQQQQQQAIAVPDELQDTPGGDAFTQLEIRESAAGRARALGQGGVGQGTVSGWQHNQQALLALQQELQGRQQQQHQLPRLQLQQQQDQQQQQQSDDGWVGGLLQSLLDP